MQKNQIYDIIVVGASLEGLALYTYLKSKSSSLKVALISKHFKNNSAKNILDSEWTATTEALHINYVRGLYSIICTGNETYYSRYVVFATGSKPIMSQFKGNNIYYNVHDFKRSEKFLKPAVVVGEDQKAVDYALTLAKKFKYVYLCSPSLELYGDKKSMQKLNETVNIVHLPSCQVVSCKHNREGKLAEVTLDTYSTINCAALVFSLGRTPDVPNISRQLVSLTESGHIKVKAFNEFIPVPNLFAIGECSSHNTKNSISVVGKLLIEKLTKQAI